MIITQESDLKKFLPALTLVTLFCLVLAWYLLALFVKTFSQLSTKIAIIGIARIPVLNMSERKEGRMVAASVAATN